MRITKLRCIEMPPPPPQAKAGTGDMSRFQAKQLCESSLKVFQSAEREYRQGGPSPLRKY
jgi:hypothetical protein